MSTASVQGQAIPMAGKGIGLWSCENIQTYGFCIIYFVYDGNNELIHVCDDSVMLVCVCVFVCVCVCKEPLLLTVWQKLHDTAQRQLGNHSDNYLSFVRHSNVQLFCGQFALYLQLVS